MGIKRIIYQRCFWIKALLQPELSEFQVKILIPTFAFLCLAESASSKLLSYGCFRRRVFSGDG